MSCYVDVILPLPVSGIFTYRVDGEHASLVKPGMRVTVQFGRKKNYTAVIHRIHSQKPEGYEIKSILSLLDDRPVVNEHQFRLWEWISDYYMCTLGEVYKAALPAGLKFVTAARKDGEKSVRKRILKKKTEPEGNEPAGSRRTELSPAQEKALREIRESFLKTDVVLLHGVTSSGKTEIYIRLIGEALEQCKQVLYLLPEIALTAQIMQRLQAAFGNRVAVYHSRFTDKERVDTWHRLLYPEGEGIRVILGARSAVFLPFSEAGLIIIDEEHENTFKQFDPAPRYHARDTSIMLARFHGARVLLGTATPSLETYYNCMNGKYSMVELTDRFGDVELPEIQVVNTRELRRKKRMHSHFSGILLDAISDALDRKEQVILFQNRRGFSLYLECELCGEIPKCRQCDVSLTYHKISNRLTCHYCGYGIPVPAACPACGSTALKMQGFGTEQIEEEIALYLPEARVARMDLDTTRRRRSFEQLIARFELHESDILVGTQMVSKGLDFDHVSLVGILNADTMLNYPDFRAHERSYQLMAQVSGRAGRKGKQGTVIIQTSDHEHPVIDKVVRNDFKGMYLSQLEERRKFHYPPFCRLIEITLRHRDRELLDKAAEFLARRLKQYTSEKILGPEYPLVSRVQNLYLKTLFIKTSKTQSLPAVKNSILFLLSELSGHPMFRSVTHVVDVDPC